MRRAARMRSFRRGAPRPERDWCSLTTNFTLSALTATGTSALVVLQQPTDLSNLTSDPPETLTVLRIVGNFDCSLTGATAAQWTLALTVQDASWTPASGTTGFRDDSDKRLLWTRTFQATNATSDTWYGDGTRLANAVVVGHAQPAYTQVDIAPKVRIQAGQALYLVGYEQAGAGTLTVTTANMRMLYQRSGRRSR